MNTRLRYEVWASVTGAISDWRVVPQGIYAGLEQHNEANKQRALERAEQHAAQCARVCVEEWDDERDVYLRTVREYPIK